MAKGTRFFASVWLIAACSGGAAPPGAAGPAAEFTTADSLPEADPVELLREVFTYRGGARDPFASLVQSGQELRPFLEDLRVTSIIYDQRYPARSVAVLRDVSTGERYEVRVDDDLGRNRVAEIRPYEVVLTIIDFGVPRQVVLAVRRRGGGNQ